MMRFPSLCAAGYAGSTITGVPEGVKRTIAAALTPGPFPTGEGERSNAMIGNE
jgi:hypothetical protein